ncbi:hypothetical protein SAY87_020008 [Trapa incisa]|uniref:DUF3511 domain protein n=1 Tax=Trapa incisa TaxID=236973 RepID=A0AAN7K6L6_9MYRT|nr:hypothetical protein SAY87_020008 [Trapa incisa]
MDGFPSSQRPCGGSVNRRMDIVSGTGGCSSAARLPYPLEPPPGMNRGNWAVQGGGRPGATAAEKPRGFTDPEMKRKKRIARYKAYGVEGRVKASLRRGMRWIKDKFSQVVNGY